jgi:hypothetical protein
MDLYCETFLEPCKAPVDFLSQSSEQTNVCMTLTATGEGCNHDDRQCTSCGCAIIESSDGVHQFAKWDHADTISTGASVRGWAVVEFDDKSLAEVNEQFFYYAETNGATSDISDLADYLNQIPEGRFVAVATNDEPFGEYSTYATELNAAWYSMGISPPPEGAEWRGAFTGFGVAGCAATSTCPDWTTSDYQERYTQTSVSEAKICIAKGNEVDAHGCFIRSGYTWCETLGTCVQNWDGGAGGPCPNVGEDGDCAEFEAIGEGCNHNDKTCGGCGCATIRRAELAQDTTKTGVNYNHNDGYRGIAVAIIDPDTLGKESNTFFTYTDIEGLATYLDTVEAGKIVAVMTNDEPFASWRDQAQININLALTAMGIPTPPEDPEYRGAYVGMGVAGCVASGDCPTWADSTYTGRYENSAVLQRTVCAGCNKIETEIKYTATPFRTVAGAVSVHHCAQLCESDLSCQAYTFKADATVTATDVYATDNKWGVFAIDNVADVHQACESNAAGVAATLATKEQLQGAYDDGFVLCAFVLLADGKFAVPSDCDTWEAGINYGATGGDQAVLCATPVSSECNLLASLPVATDGSGKETNTEYASGVPGCDDATCSTIRLVGEGCNHDDRQCGSCGCATLSYAEPFGQPVHVEYDHSNNDAYYRGISVLEFNPVSLELNDQTFIMWNKLSGTSDEYLSGKLNGIAEGTVVAIATNDEPFQYWRGAAQTAVNAALESMGIPPPDNDPEYRGGFAGFGVAGCAANGDCPQWATSSYTGRYSSVARAKATICPEVTQSRCAPSGTYKANECCPAGYGSVSDARECEEMLTKFSTTVLSGYSFDGATPAWDTVDQRPSGCFYDASSNTLQYNRLNVAGQGVLRGSDMVICKRQTTVSPAFEKGGYTFENPTPECSFTAVGASFYQRNKNYPACQDGFADFITPEINSYTGEIQAREGFCCSGHCASTLASDYVYDATDQICSNSFAKSNILFGEAMESCTAAPPTNKYCEWTVGAAEGNDAISAWKNYIIRAQMSFSGKSAGVTLRVQDPTDPDTQRYWLKFTGSDSTGGGAELAFTYFDGHTESVIQATELNMVDPIVMLHTAPIATAPAEADLISEVESAIVIEGLPRINLAADRWTEAVFISGTGSEIATDITQETFNSMFQTCPIVRYRRNGAVWAIYKRTNLNSLSEIDAYSLFTYLWASANNNLNVDFEIYSNEVDMRNDENKWTYCNYDDPDVGFPRDCGRSAYIGNTWFSMPDGAHAARGLSQGAGFDIYSGDDCPVSLAASCEDAACNGADSTLTGTGEYCPDGAGWSCCDTTIPVNNAGCTEAPCWSQGDTCPDAPVTDAAGWEVGVLVSDDGSTVASDIGETDFNTKFQACPVVRYNRNGAEFAVYKRIDQSDVAGINAYQLFTETWSSSDNIINQDFELFSNSEDMRNGVSQWSFCNYDDPDVGFPRDCGPSGGIPYIWFSMPGGTHGATRGLSSGASFELYTGSNCPVKSADTSGWTTAVELSSDGSSTTTDIGQDAWNAIFDICPVVRYTRNGAVKAVYKRTNLHTKWPDAYNLFTYTWSSSSNSLNVDFEIYDDEVSMRNGANKWQYCNYNDPDVGFPRDCGKTGNVGGEWFSMPGGTHSPPSISSGAKFELYSGSDCPVVRTDGYCTVRNPDLGAFSNQVSCPNGVNWNIGFKISAEFPVTVAGAYEFDFNVDFGWGGLVLIDGVEAGSGYYSGDMWWSSDYNRAIPLDMTVDLDMGMHSLIAYGAEGCCDGTSNLRFKKPGDVNWSFLTEANLKDATIDEHSSKIVKSDRTFKENTMYDVEIKTIENAFVVMVDGDDYATYHHSALSYGSVGLQTWQSELEVSSLQFLKNWVSDDKLSHCDHMLIQPSYPEDTDATPLTPKIAQDVCSAFRSDGCIGFLFTSRASQFALTGETVASVTFCSGKMSKTDDTTVSDPVGWLNVGGI